MQVTGTQSSASAASGSAANAARKTMTSEDFLQLLITQMTRQDPMQPMDSNQLLSQLSQIQNMQASSELTDSMKGLVNNNELSSASNLIGKMISGVDMFGKQVAGQVLSVQVQNGQVQLQVGNTLVPFDGIQTVSGAPAASAVTGGTQ